MEIWTGFVVGLVGSLHCIGMCGPIVAALPSDSSRWSLLAGRLLYNFGRVITYSFLGALFGLLGRSLVMAGFQEWLSISLGVLIMLAVLVPTRFTQPIIGYLALNHLFTKATKVWGKLFRSKSRPALLTIGILNGFLPCGFVYIGIAGAVSTSTALSGAAYMGLFGLGTVPIMLALGLLGNFVTLSLRRKLSRAVPAFAVVLAVLFILRGLSLGIPYVSPKLAHAAITASNATAEPSCCAPVK
jgi:hypothetical protein